MNILPLVCVILLLLSYGSALLLHERIATYWEEKSYLAFMNASRDAANKLIEKQFKKTKKAISSNDDRSKSDESSKSHSSYKCKRDRLNPLSKFNLAPLLNTSSPILYETAAKLLLELYKEAPFFKNPPVKELHYQILDLMLQRAKQNPSLSFAEFFPEDPVLKEIYYKMLLGTRNFQFEKHIGYPSLQEYFSIDNEQSKKAICFSFASKPLLLALFGTHLTEEILEEEKKKWEETKKNSSLTKAELEILFSKLSQKPFNLSEIEEFLSFSQKAPKRKIVEGKDSPSGIIVKKKIPS